MEPLAALLRPKTLNDYVGQEHITGEGKPLRVAIEKKQIFSFILWGPPGVGKTTLARIYAQAINADYHELSAVSAGKEDLRRIVETEGLLFGPRVLFLDEIHRFTKAQQDFLLPYVEKGTLVLIGATTENPSFEVIPALLSRARVFTLRPLDDRAMKLIISKTKIVIPEDATDWLIAYSSGDARKLLTIIDHTHGLYHDVTLESLKTTLQSASLRYDKKGEDHYNTISAFIKSMRASQADAALYYLARMITSGEDPVFIARRMVIFASEDIGLADPMAILVANAVFTAVTTIGLPECGINLSHGAVYLSQAPKSRASYDAYKEALFDAQNLPDLFIPLHLRNAVSDLLVDEGYGKGYLMYDTKSYLPEKLQGKTYL